jgi:hypothetical protein
MPGYCGHFFPNSLTVDWVLLAATASELSLLLSPEPAFGRWHLCQGPFCLVSPCLCNNSFNKCVNWICSSGSSFTCVTHQVWLNTMIECMLLWACSLHSHSHFQGRSWGMFNPQEPSTPLITQKQPVQLGRMSRENEEEKATCHQRCHSLVHAQMPKVCELILYRLAFPPLQLPRKGEVFSNLVMLNTVDRMVTLYHKSWR